MKKILHLTLKKKWFDMVLSGVKKEEYREEKYYWIKRLVNEYDNGVNDLPTYEFKQFDIVRFTNGYGKDAPTFDIECKGIRIDNDGKPEWGADGGYCFIISLGEILSTQNIPTPNP